MCQQIQLNMGICDDNPVMLDNLAGFCHRILDDRYSINMLKAQTPTDLLKDGFPMQIAILDVQLVETSGIQLARDLLSRNPSCRILFVSGYLHAVSEVYEVPHFCFILKDQLEQQLPKFLLRAAQLSAEEAGQSVLLTTGRKTEQLQLADISVLERRGHSTFITLRDGTELQTREKLTSILKRIQNQVFLRCHISYAVNLRDVQSLEDRCFRMGCGQMVPISRPNERTCQDAFFRYLSLNMIKM